MKISKNLLAWRRKQKRGAIMSPATFAKIKRRAARKYGIKRAARIAGRAYWISAKAKYAKRKKK